MTPAEQKTSLPTHENLDLTHIQRELQRERPLAELPVVEIFRLLLNQFLKLKIEEHAEDDQYSLQQAAMELTQYFFGNSFAGSHFMYDRVIASKAMRSQQANSVDQFADIERSIDAIRTQLHAVMLQVAPQHGVQHLAGDGWSFLSRNYAEAGPTKYRVYLSPDATGIAPVIQSFLMNLRTDVPFQIKTMYFGSNAAEFARGDKIVMYLSDKNARQMLAALQVAYASHERYFKNRYAPGGGIYSPAAGVSVTTYRDKTSGLTGSQHVAAVMERAFSALFNPAAIDRLGSFADIAQLSHAREGQILWEILQFLSTGYGSPINRMLVGVYDDNDRQKCLVGMWKAVLMRGFQPDPITFDQFKTSLRSYLDNDQQLAQLRDLNQETVSNIVHQVLMRFGMFTLMTEALSSGALPGDALQAQLAEFGFVYDPAKDPI